METKELYIRGIPAVLRGNPDKRLIVAVHGLHSNKSDAVITALAAEAGRHGYGVLSFDLPEHGDRAMNQERCSPEKCISDIEKVLRFAATISSHVSVFAVSMGVYFTIMACKKPVESAFFLSPVTDFEYLLENMMKAAHIDEASLKLCKCLHTHAGPDLYWDDYAYVCEHKPPLWQTPTDILCGSKDEVFPVEKTRDFARKHGCDIAVIDGAEHWFHTFEQLRIIVDRLNVFFDKQG